MIGGILMHATITLWKKDFWLSYKVMLWFIILVFMYSFLFPSVIFYGIAILLVCFHTFQEEKASPVYIFIKSLPIRVSAIVISRYSFLFILTIVLAFIVRLFNWLASNAQEDNYMSFVISFQNQDIIFIFSIVLMILSITIPLLYALKGELIVGFVTVFWGVLGFFTLLQADRYADQQTQYSFFEQPMRGASDWIEHVIPVSPFISVMLAVLFYSFSMLITIHILKRKP